MRKISALAALLALAGTAAAAPLRVAVLSDLNGEYGSCGYDRPVLAAVKKLAKEKPDLVVLAGDMIAGGKYSLPDAQVERMWGCFRAAVAAPLAAAGVPVAPAPGNHDASAYAGGARDRLFYQKEWLAAKPAVHFLDDRKYPFEYAFSAGGALFLVLDQTTTAALSPERLAWVDRTLTGNYGYKARIVVAHLPLYPFARGREKEATFDRALEELLARHKVSLVVSGHDHAFYPGRRGGLRFAGTGCLGGGPRKLLGGNYVAFQSYTMLVLGDYGALSVDAYAWPDFQPIRRGELPASVGAGADKYTREDLPEAAAPK